VAEPLRATFFAFRRREPRGVLARAAVVHIVLSAAMLLSAGVAGFLIVGETRAGTIDGPVPLVGHQQRAQTAATLLLR
jgi:hypothetical protein